MSTDNNTTTFASFNLPKPLQDALETMRHRIPTPIQAKGIPQVLEGKDLIGIAQTGTGKTAAFGIPIVCKLIEDKDAQAVILVPTRELAVQIYEVMRQLTQNVKTLKAWVLVGGTSMYAQVKSLPRMPRLIIATPGRLMDHLQQRTFSLANLKIVVLDEADRMLDIGFEPQIKRIFHHIPKERQTLLFSATFPKTIERLTREYMNIPAKVTVGKISEPAKEIEQSFIQTTVGMKNDLLIQELNERKGSVIVFVRTKHKVDRIAQMLKEENFIADRIHGARTQSQRTRVMEDFRNKYIKVLVATDVASRGLDIPHIEHVINFDLPEIPEDYVHRIGRTARAGAKGQSVSFVTSEDKSKWMYLSRHLNALGAKVALTPMKPLAGRAAVVSTATASTPVQKTEESTEQRPYERNYARPKYRPGARNNSRPGARSDSRSFGNRSDSRPAYGRPESRPGARSDSRPSYGRPESRPSPRSDDRPYNRDARPVGRTARPAFGRSDARSIARAEFRPSDRSESRPYNRDARSIGARPSPRSDSRPAFGRSEERTARTDGRPGRPYNRDARPAGRTDSRPSFGRPSPRAGARTDARQNTRTDIRQNTRDSRPTSGRADARTYTRPSSRSETRTKE